MVRHLIYVCIFCFICATHSPCASHAAVGLERPQHLYNNKFNDPIHPPLEENLKTREKLVRSVRSDAPHDDNALANGYGKQRHLTKRDVINANSDSDLVLKQLFLKYGDGSSMNIEGFEKLMKRLDLLQHLAKGVHENGDDHDHQEHGHGQNATCFNKTILTTLTNKQSEFNHSSFLDVCPVLLLSVVSDRCAETIDDGTFQVRNSESSGVSDMNSDRGLIWIYSILAVILISVCGVLALAIIPVMQKKFYKPLIQFLVALAVGTLAGDALLHLLPHAMTSSHSHEHGDRSPNHDENTWKGFVAMLGLTFFFIMERLILLIGKWRKNSQKHKQHTHVKVINDKNGENQKNDTQCMDRYNPSPYCYKDIMGDPTKTFLESDKTATTVLELLGSNSDITSGKKCRSPTMEKLEPSELVTEANKMIPHDHEDYTVIVREHSNDHHGHSHKHGHVHAAPHNFSSVAWMVIMGDGLHNFTDGMAIGAAFSSGLAGGFSTTVAVLCHELPHELGDFAMLLKAGMSIKQALFYNLLSSLLCILGNLFGLWLGNTESANSWVFAVAAGTFIYIALVDMIPELSSAHEDEDNLLQCVLHLGGLLLGFAIMTVIALYEPDLKHLFHDQEY